MLESPASAPLPAVVTAHLEQQAQQLAHTALPSTTDTEHAPSTNTAAAVIDAMQQAQHGQTARGEATAPAPHIQAEMAHDGSLTKEATERLFQHYAERRDEGDSEEEEEQTTAQPDPRVQSREVRRPSKDPGDRIQDGIEGDFVADSAIVAADLDTHPTPHGTLGDGDAAIDAWTGRRRRRGDAKGPANPLRRPQRRGDKENR